MSADPKVISDMSISLPAERADPDEPEPKPTEAGDHLPLLLQLLAAVGVPLGRSRVVELARDAGLRGADGAQRTEAETGAELERLVGSGHIEGTPRGFQCRPEQRFAAFREAALSGRLRAWHSVVLNILGANVRIDWHAPPSFEHAVATARVALCAGLPIQRMQELLGRYRTAARARAFLAAFAMPFDSEILALMPIDWRDTVVRQILSCLLEWPQPSAPAVIVWAQRRAAEPDAPAGLRYQSCEHLLWQARWAEAERLIEGDSSGIATALRAAGAVMQGAYAQSVGLYRDAEQSLRAALKLRREKKTLGRCLPLSVAFPRAAALIALDERQALAEARRYCRQEARCAVNEEVVWVWDQLESAAEARLEPDRVDRSADISPDGDSALHDLIDFEIASWLRLPLDKSAQQTLVNWLEAFRAASYEWAVRELEAARALALGQTPQPPFESALAGVFARETPWRRAMVALAALADQSPAATGQSETRLVWVVHPETPTHGLRIEAREQKRGPRGWNRGKPLSPGKLGQLNLSQQDARVLHKLGSQYGYSGGNPCWCEPNTCQALSALVGHPLVFFDGDFVRPVELVAGGPELIIERRKEGGATVRLPAELAKELSAAKWSRHEAHAQRGQQIDYCLLTRESLTRARVVRLTSAHRRAAEVIGGGLAVPDEGLDELKTVVTTVAQLFEIHSEIAAAVPEAAADPTLRAELAPAGGGLRLRFSVQPFGEAGPRYVPGVGGERVIAEVNAERRAALRDLDAERRSLAQVLERLPFLDDEPDSSEWIVDDPERCLELVESLQAMSGDGMRVEWPAGKKFQVTRQYQSTDLKLRIAGGRDWFTVSGGLALDDGTVLEMRRLIELTRANGGRYLPLGAAGFLALGEDLRRRLEELARAGSDEADGSLSFSALAASVVAGTLEDAQLSSNPDWQARLLRLGEANTLQVEPPSTLQTELRPYQVEGFRWLARLAHWGAGACLADDMGLGKTVQAIALFLHRASGGAALVVAPTSVCSNWLDELARFAPALNVRLFGGAGRTKIEGAVSGSDRESLVAGAGAFDVVICSYTLLQQALEGFTARPWHTLVLDEAQAVKNFATKRAQAVLELSADFRVVTTGTPVENRLDELWMLFRFLNPGLLGSREHFNERFAAPIERRSDSHARTHLRKLIAPFVLRRTKSEVLTELPPRTEIVHSIETGERERAFHEALRQSALEAIAAGALPPEQRRFRVLVELMRLRRACCDPRLVAANTGVDSLVGAKLEAFAELAQELAAGRHKTLVFSQFVDYLELLRAQLETLGLSYQYLDGSTPAAERACRVRAFQSGEGDFFLISLKAGGFGLNLTAADYVIIADPWWNPAVEDQATGRAHRMGQQRPVTVYRLILKDSIEERIMSLHRDKRALAEGLFTGEEFGKALSVEELTALLREE